jgi:hypothetical protein
MKRKQQKGRYHAQSPMLILLELFSGIVGVVNLTQSGLLAVLERFPEQKGAIRTLYLKSESFQTLCSDYEQCAAAFSYWNGEPGQEALRRSQEYRDLLAELDEEVRRILV